MLKAWHNKENPLAEFSNHAEGVAQIETGILFQTYNVKKGAKAPEYNEYHHINGAVSLIGILAKNA